MTRHKPYDNIMSANETQVCKTRLIYLIPKGGITMKALKSNKGFTLIELVVVIVILGILMLLIIPRVGEFQANAEVRTCQGNQRTLGTAQGMYYSEYRTVTTSIASLSPYTGSISNPVSTCSLSTTAADPYFWSCTASSGSKSHGRRP